MEVESGSIVLSKRGRDAGRYFIVIRREGEYVWIADGKVRRVKTPKKKKIKHLEPTGGRHEGIGAKFAEGRTVFDSEVYSALKSLNLEKEDA